MFEQAGFRFVDDFIWDKGEVESQRHKNGDTPYPLYQYPMNCYEHVFVFYKHRQDDMLYPCPVCGCLKVNGNAYSGVGEAVLDPFAGSFTTAIEAQQLRRNGIGIELNKATFRDSIIDNLIRNIEFNQWCEYDVD